MSNGKSTKGAAAEEDDEPNLSGCRKSLETIFRWDGSVYKFVWIEFITFVIAYLSISLVYQFLLNDHGKSDFEAIAAYSSRFTSTVPIVLLLGFFTSTCMQRSFTAMNTIPGCSKVITIFATTLKGNLPEGRAHAIVQRC